MGKEALVRRKVRKETVRSLIWGEQEHSGARADVDSGCKCKPISAAVAHLLLPPFRLPPQAGELLLERHNFPKRREFRPTHFLPCTQLFHPHAQKPC